MFPKTKQLLETVGLIDSMSSEFPLAPTALLSEKILPSDLGDCGQPLGLFVYLL